MSEMQEPPVMIAEGELYTLRSCDHGATYLLSSKEENSSAHLEGDDLTGFLAAYEEAKTQYPGYSTDQILAQLWDQGGYSWMAVPDED